MRIILLRVFDFASPKQTENPILLLPQPQFKKIIFNFVKHPKMQNGTRGKGGLIWNILIPKGSAIPHPKDLCTLTVYPHNFGNSIFNIIVHHISRMPQNLQIF